jgi:hypothetical protein
VGLAAIMSEHHSGSTSLFGIFLLAIYSLIVIPYTIYHLCNVPETAAVQPWEKVGAVVAAGRRAKGWARVAGGFCGSKSLKSAGGHSHGCTFDLQRGWLCWDAEGHADDL